MVVVQSVGGVLGGYLNTNLVNIVAQKGLFQSRKYKSFNSTRTPVG